LSKTNGQFVKINFIILSLKLTLNSVDKTQNVYIIYTFGTGSLVVQIVSHFSAFLDGEGVCL